MTERYVSTFAWMLPSCTGASWETTFVLAPIAASIAADRRNSPIPPGLSPYHGPKAERS